MVRNASSSTSLPTSRQVMLLVDFINPLRFDGAEALGPMAVNAAQAAARVKRRLRAEGVVAIYVNDNFGEWQSDVPRLLRECRRSGGAAAKLAKLLAPDDDDLVVLKPRHSGFYQTPLELLLSDLKAKDLVIVGLSTDYCVQCTAMDAYVRGYRVWVPGDCTAAESPQRRDEALRWMKGALKARISPAEPPDEAPRARRRSA
ncbi:cysteine hydrolase [Mitsuaria sp. GD03876]|uniref:cysteine hydrolase family protein n=1 Tax=Mitsuaria sp. GD03876 TaxID=2975399 RepID=UPI00244760AD|nr:cysteine hydrolase [Mitsuaria sp. GD03876]MDH0867127.1 cysteine hydrolase [Mitsuaria sp. GD03876]